MPEILSKKLLKAYKFASLAHETQKRWDKSKTPYISHPAAVGMILSTAGLPETVVIAGILHDIIEDTTFTYDDIKNEFGVAVADLVQHCSEDKSVEFDQRKDAYVAHLGEAPAEACAISAADLLANTTDNLLGIEDDGDDTWLKPPHSDGIERKMARGWERIEAIKSKIDLPFMPELENKLTQLHTIFKERIK